MAAMGGAGWEGGGCHVERSPGRSFNDVFAALLLIPGQTLIDCFNPHTNTTCVGLQMSRDTRQTFGRTLNDCVTCWRESCT